MQDVHYRYEYRFYPGGKLSRSWGSAGVFGLPICSDLLLLLLSRPRILAAFERRSDTGPPPETNNHSKWPSSPSTKGRARPPPPSKVTNGQNSDVWIKGMEAAKKAAIDNFLTTKAAGANYFCFSDQELKGTQISIRFHRNLFNIYKIPS